MDCFKLNDDGRRKIVAEGLLEISRIIRDGHEDLDHASISCALSLARINDQPVDVAELARIAGVPRPTVIRKVKVWQDQGMVKIHKLKGRTYVLPTRDGATNENSMWLWSSYERIFRDVARNLSKVDMAQVSLLNNSD